MPWINKVTKKTGNKTVTDVGGSFLEDVYGGIPTGDPAFPPGQVSVSQAARQALGESGYRVEELLACHVRCHWGDVGDAVAEENQAALDTGRGIVTSVYRLDEGGSGESGFIVVATEMKSPFAPQTRMFTVTEQ